MMNPCPKPVKPILLTGKKYTKFRREVAKRAGERCEAASLKCPQCKHELSVDHTPEYNEAKPYELVCYNCGWFSLERFADESTAKKGYRCNAHAPVLIYGVFDVFNCGHVAHIVRRRKGGDVLSNVKWKCYHHHIEIEHGPQWGNLERINER